MRVHYQDVVHEIIASQRPQSPTAQEVLRYLEELLEGVSIDSAQLTQNVESALTSSRIDRNLFQKVADTFFNLFGLKLVSNGDCLSIQEVALGQGNQLLQIDQQQARNIISAIVMAVDDAQRNTEQLAREKGYLEDSASSAARSTENLRRECENLRRSLELQEKKTLQAVQRILAQQPELVPAGTEEQNPLLLFFEDLGLTWSWDADQHPDDFTVYTISDPANAGTRQPCLYRDGKPVLKGLRYQVEDG